MSDPPIKTMKLYAEVERVFNELKAAGIGEQDPIPLELLSRFDQYHYFGADAVHEAIAALGLGEQDQVLDLGSGIGGPARVLAAGSGCRVTALELQADLHATARTLTKRCGLHHRVEHLNGNFLDSVVAHGQFDAVVSWLVFLHIPERERLYQGCFEALRPGGRLWIEDFFERAPVHGPGSPRPRRQALLPLPAEPGSIRRGFAPGRLRGSGARGPQRAMGSVRRRAHRRLPGIAKRQIELHGQAVFEGLADFYTTVTRLFESTRFGGIRVSARRPS